MIDMLSIRPVVVSYRNSTSNHNNVLYNTIRSAVVSYRNSTSNHNLSIPPYPIERVVSYRNSTSNHNVWLSKATHKRLYLIEILHQTTTEAVSLKLYLGCILSKFYIKPQLGYLRARALRGCILSKFYIKPQPAESVKTACVVVSYRNSTSNHNFLHLL